MSRAGRRAAGSTGPLHARGLALVLLSGGLAAAPEAPGQTPPSNLTATAVSASRIDLAWTGSGAFATYNVYRDGLQVATGLPGTAYSDTGLTAFTEYAYFVTAVVFGSESAPSNTVLERTLDGTGPSTPTGLAGTPISTTQVDLVWTASTDPETGIADYIVYRDGVEAGRSPTTSYSDIGLQPDTRYTYRVSAVNGDGIEGSTSAPEQVTTLPPVPPPPPTGLAATAISTSQVDLAWNASPAGDVIGYRVYRDGAPIADPTGTTYRDSGLSPFTTYTYTVTARDSEGLESDPSLPAQATTFDATPPTRPGNLAANATGSTTVQLTWSPSSDPETGVAAYHIFRDGVQVASTPGTSYLDTGLSPSTTYVYRVSALNGQGLESQRSTAASATTFDATGPTTPQNLSASAVGTDRIDLNWSASSDPESGIAEYRIYRDGVQVAATFGTSFSDTGLTPATTYEYRVSAVNGQGLESDRSAPASATTLDATPPTTPQDLVATAVGTSRIDLVWSASSDPETGVSEYRVFRDGAQIGTTPLPSYQDDGLTPATRYEYYVVAINGDGLESARSVTAAATTFDGSGPSTPTDLTATAVATDRVDLTWTASDDPESGIQLYRIFRDGGEVGTSIGTGFQDDGLQPSTTYEYRVSAVNGQGLESDLSDPAFATTLDGSGPTAPTDLVAEVLGKTEVSLTWTASEDPETGVESYNVYRDGAAVASVVATSFVDTGLTPGTEYAYSVAAVNGEGVEGARSEVVRATTSPAEDVIPPAAPTGLRVVAP